jgi:hypothetical protein
MDSINGTETILEKWKESIVAFDDGWDRGIGSRKAGICPVECLRRKSVQDVVDTSNRLMRYDMTNGMERTL